MVLTLYFFSSKTNYTWKLGLIINIQRQGKSLFKRKALISSHFLFTNGSQRKWVTRTEMETQAQARLWVSPPRASASHFYVLRVHLVSFPEVCCREPAGGYMSEPLSRGKDGPAPTGGSSRHFNISGWVPPYSVSVGGEPTGLFFQRVSLGGVRSIRWDCTKQHFFNWPFLFLLQWRRMDCYFWLRNPRRGCGGWGDTASEAHPERTDLPFLGTQGCCLGLPLYCCI